jgi:hypothetical protein
MPRFTFALSTTELVREAGVIKSESLAEALDLVGEHATVNAGDTLEIGVRGFPPARFECVSTMIKGSPLWRAHGRLAA